MDLKYTPNIPADFNDNSRVWIYQCSREFTETEIEEIEMTLNKFAANWKSHCDKVKGFAGLFFNRFIILIADETATGVSGCSTDSSVHIIKQIGQAYQVDLFNRHSLALYVKDKIQSIPLVQLNYALENEIITMDTLYFNNTVLTKKELETKWIIPVKESWLTTKLKAV